MDNDTDIHSTHIYIYYVMHGFTYFSQKVGVTTTIPDKVPYTLPTTNARNYEWTYSGKTLFHNLSSTELSYPNLDDGEVGNKVGLLITSNRELHLFFDENLVCKLATDLPVEKPVFGTVDVQDRCFMIKSEILCGELDGVYICTYMYVGRSMSYISLYNFCLCASHVRHTFLKVE